ncbi:alpha-amylase family glycosyl hydrolase [Microbulbifer bruguierae]|uniref:Alpha-amylase n=1 Tax=Microbulbifer bruguierae TaxID=3029061 RepID=A0ABY8NJB6_9GAMM|nr:alpha-amylase family glycosyl hydrolase [Microbulbifer bruguierae]WGL18429.1 alpha-amylase family glycosyl hydrolase [Microbulbifer bruguierae]
MKKIAGLTSVLSAAALALAACSDNNTAEQGVPHSDASSTSLAEAPLTQVKEATADPFWRNATVYFMLPDRFHNGNPGNDLSYGRQADAAYMRGFHGGDLRGVIQKLDEGYFTDLGVDAIWMSPVVENVHGFDEGDKRTYAFHGYWPKDWTAVDANLGSEADLAELIDVAHKKGVRVLMDVIINHTGPVTSEDPLWPSDWVRTNPQCDWSSFAQNVQCALTNNLPDILTESEEPVALPPQLTEKWQREGRLEQEVAELDAFFARTGYPRAPKYYIVKWLTDWVREYGVDGFRVDTVKHTEPEIWAVLKKEASLALAEWKAAHASEKLDDREFFMVGEVYHYGINNFANSEGRFYDYGDRKVDFFNYGFDSLINMGFAAHAAQDMETIFSQYSGTLHEGELQGVSVLNYLGSHDDHHSFDRERKQVKSAALKLMLAPGAAQIYYGDEVARPMIDEQAYGDASMRVPMDWASLQQTQTQEILSHWQKLGQFRRAHFAVGAGVHQKLSDTPYVFSRTLEDDRVMVALDLPAGRKTLSAEGVFAEGALVKDYYSGAEARVENGMLAFDTQFDILLLGSPANQQMSAR